MTIFNGKVTTPESLAAAEAMPAEAPVPAIGTGHEGTDTASLLGHVLDGLKTGASTVAAGPATAGANALKSVGGPDLTNGARSVDDLVGDVMGVGAATAAGPLGAPYLAKKAMGGLTDIAGVMGGGQHAPDMIRPEDAKIGAAGSEHPAPGTGTPGEGSASINAKFKGGGGGGGGMPADQHPLDKAVEEQKAAVTNAATIESHRLQEQAKLDQQALEQQQALELKRQQNEVMLQQRQEDMAQKQAAIADKMSSMDGAVDPNRWLNSRTPGQKFLMVLASALSGGEAMKTFQSAIDEDVRAQQHSFENGMSKLKGVQDANQSAYGMFRSSGLDARQSFLAAKDFVGDQFKKQADMLANTSQSQAVVEKAKGVSAGLDATKIKDTQTMNLARRAQVLNEVKEYNDHNEKMSATSLKSAHGGKGLIELKPVMVEEVNKAKKLTMDLGELMKSSKSVDSQHTKLGAKIQGMASDILGSTTDSGDYNVKRDSFVPSFVRMMQHDAPSKAEYDTYDKQVPRGGDMRSGLKLKELSDRIFREREAQLDTYEQSGYDVSKLRQQLEEDKRARGASSISKSKE